MEVVALRNINVPKDVPVASVSSNQSNLITSIQQKHAESSKIVTNNSTTTIFDRRKSEGGHKDPATNNDSLSLNINFDESQKLIENKDGSENLAQIIDSSKVILDCH